MKPTRPLTRAVLATAFALSVLVNPARSQTAPTAPAKPGEEKKDAVITLDAVSVTGTNIKRLDQEKVLPVTVFSKDLMDTRNAITPVELLTALPQVTNIPLNESTAGGANSRGDNANVNLRGIGSANTLVLLNGRRAAPNPMTSPDAGMLAFSVNVNQLPTQGIERIDVLRDGASSIYGSDAVAGVINYITRKDFRGAEARTRIGVPEHGGGQNLQGTLTYGRDFAGGKGRWLSTFDFMWRDPIYMNQREFSRTAAHYANAPAPFNIAGSPFDGRATVGNWPTFRVGTGTATNYFRPLSTGTPGLTTSAPTRAANPEFYLDINSYQNLGYSKSDRQNMFNSVEYDINDRLTAFVDFSVYHSNTTLVRQPVFLNAPSGDLLKPVSVDNPYNPYGSRFYSPTGAANSDGTPRLTGTPQALTLLAVSFNDLGGETVVVHGGVYRGVAGVRGKLGRDWTWESGLLYTRAYTSDISFGAVRESAFAASLMRNDASAFNPFGYTFKVSGNAVVADKAYVNPKATLDQFNQIWRREGFSGITSWDAHTDGPIFSYWGNTVSLAVGTEVRREQFIDHRAQYVGNNGVGNPLNLNPEDNDFILASPKPDSSGNRNVYSAYAETVVPVIAPKHKLAFTNSLELTASARFEKYSDFGKTTRPKVGLNWKPYNGLMVRASFNEGFAAPNLPTLYAPTQYTVDSAPGNTDVYRLNAGTSDSLYSMRNYSAGNPKLQPVTSIGRSVGLVLEVPKVKGLTVTADYWNIDQSNVIGSRSATQILNSDATLLAAYVQSQIAAGKTAAQIDLGSGTANYKGDPAVVRFAPSATDIAAFAAANANKPASQQMPVAGIILSRTGNYENIAKAYASGIDLSLAYQLPTLPIGRLSLTTDWSYIIRSYQFRALAGVAPLFTERLDVDGTTRWRGTGTITWRKPGSGWSAGLSAYYTGSYADTGASTTAANYNTYGTPRYISRQWSDGAYVYRYRVHDVVSFNGFLQRRFGPESPKWLRGSSLRLGIINLTDKEPPLVSGAFGFSSSVHGSLFQGRTWTMEITRQF